MSSRGLALRTAILNPIFSVGLPDPTLNINHGGGRVPRVLCNGREPYAYHIRRQQKKRGTSYLRRTADALLRLLQGGATYECNLLPWIVRMAFP